MDFDMTQVVTHSDTEGEDENNKSTSVANIKVLNQPSLKKKIYPIYQGDNTIGRQDLCQVSIPVRSLSKKHACIEVRGRSHFLYDMGSRNRTRRGTHYLTPEVRYELKNNDMIVFADVSCMYLVEDFARASDSGSETDPMSESETVFHTVAVDLYNSVEPRIVNQELIETAVASDRNSCDSAASSDILMPTQDFEVVKINQESQKKTEPVQSNKSPVNKNSKEVIKILVVDSDSDNEPEIVETKDSLHFQNNGNCEDSLDMDLLAAATQAYVADSEEDDDNKSEILDMVHDYKTADDQSGLFVPDSQAEESPKPLATDSEEVVHNKQDKNGSASPLSPFRSSLAIGSPRTYSRKGTNSQSKPAMVSSQSVDAAKDDQKMVEEEDFEETQDPNLFALPTLITDEIVLQHSPSPDNKSPLASPNEEKKVTLNSIDNETVVVTTTIEMDTIPIDNDVATSPFNNKDAYANSVKNDDNTEVTIDQATTLLISDTIPVSSSMAVSCTKDDLVSVPITKDSQNANSILNEESTTLVVNEEEQLETIEIIAEETIPVNVDAAGDIETVEMDQLQEELTKQSQEGNSSMAPTLQVEEKLNNVGDAESGLKTTITSRSSEELSSKLVDGENFTESNKNLSENETIKGPNLELITPVKGKKKSLQRTEVELADECVSGLITKTPFTKMRSSDDEVLEATQPYTINCMDSPSMEKGRAKAKRTLPFTVGHTGVSASDIEEEEEEEETQPYGLEQTSKSDKKQLVRCSPAYSKRNRDHDISDEDENSVELSEKESCLKDLSTYKEAETLPLQGESERDKEKMESESQNAESTVRKSQEKKIPALKSKTKETLTESVSSKVEPSKTEKSLSQNEEKILNAPEESSNLGNANMTEETSEPGEVLPSEELCSSVQEKQTFRSLKESERSKEEIVVRKSGRTRKKKTTEKKESTEDVIPSAGQSCSTDSSVGIDEKTAVEKKNISETKKPLQKVHFVGVSSSEDDSQESKKCQPSSFQQKSQEGDKRKLRRPRKEQEVKGSKDDVSAKKTNINKCEESSTRPSRGCRLKTDTVDKGDKQKKTSFQKIELEENKAVENKNQRRETRANSSSNECSTKMLRGRRSRSNNDNTEENENGTLEKAETREMIVSKESSEEKLSTLENKALKKESTVEKSKVPSEPTEQSKRLEETIPVEEEKKGSASKSITKTSKTKAGKITGKEKNKTEEDGPALPTASSGTNKSPKSKHEDQTEENISKKSPTELPSNKRVSRSSKGKTCSSAIVLEDSENVPESVSTDESTPKTRRTRRGKTESQEPEVAPKELQASKRTSQSKRKASQEAKSPEDTPTSSRSSRSIRAQRQNDQEGKRDAEQVTLKEKSLQKQTKKDSVNCSEVPGTRVRPKSKMSKNLHKESETNLLDNNDNDDDFVMPPSNEQSSERAASQERISSSSLSVNLERINLVPSDLVQDNESAKSAKSEPRTSRKRNLSSLSDTQSIPSLSSPKRQNVNSSILSPGTPSSRSLSTGSKPKVMFTGVTDDKLQKNVTDLGGSVVTDFNCCTHLVTDKIRRTVKFLCCLSRGIPIVSPSWLTNCKSAKMFTDYTSHIVSDPATEKQYKFSLKNSLQQARAGPLLENYKIHVTKSVKPNVDQMKEIMDSCKAEYLRKMPNKKEENTIVISCEEDRTLCQPALNAGIPIVNAEFILTGILKYDISVSKYQIFNSCSTTTTTPNKRKTRETNKGNTAAKKQRR